MDVTYPSDKPPRRTIDHVRQDCASAVKALRVHAEWVGRLRAEGKVSHTAKLSNAAHLKAEAEHCEELERTILKHFNAAVRKSAKGDE